MCEHGTETFMAMKHAVPSPLMSEKHPQDCSRTSCCSSPLPEPRLWMSLLLGGLCAQSSLLTHLTVGTVQSETLSKAGQELNIIPAKRILSPCSAKESQCGSMHSTESFSQVAT